MGPQLLKGVDFSREIGQGELTMANRESGPRSQKGLQVTHKYVQLSPFASLT